MMKTSVFIPAIAALALISCKKQYTCDCQVQQNVMGFSQTVNSTHTTPKMTKAEARDYCKSDAAQDIGGTSQSVSCKLHE